MKSRISDQYFSEIEEKREATPERISRSEARRLWYQKKRYMKDWSDSKVAQEAVNHIERITPFVLKDGPKLPQDRLAELMMIFGDFIEESNIRGLDLKELKKFINI